MDVLFGFQDTFKLGNQYWQVLSNNYPKDIEIDIIIPVDQPVSQADHLKPG